VQIFVEDGLDQRQDSKTPMFNDAVVLVQLMKTTDSDTAPPTQPTADWKAKYDKLLVEYNKLKDELVGVL
jgi:hypothetical protein